MIILLIRHGESEADILNVHEGRANFHLTEKGNKQALAMSQFIKANYNITKLYSSPLNRAKETAKYLSDTFNLDVIYDDNLMEFNNGLLAGLSREEALIKYPIIPNLPIDKSIYGMESKLEFRNRAKLVLNKLKNENDDNDIVAVVTHGGMINQLYYELLKLPVINQTFFATSDTGIHIWKINDKDTYIICSNYSYHTKNII